MGTLYLVRHGQASFGADNYDQLSPLGYQQSFRLGQYLKHRGVKLDAVLTGTLQRHAQTWEGIKDGGDFHHERHSWSGLNEYDSQAVIASVHPETLPRPDTPELYKHHFRLLRKGLTLWMQGTQQPRGMSSYAEFTAGVQRVLDHVRENFDGTVLLVSSGGPIATAVGQVLGTPCETTVELNMRLRNSALTEFSFNLKRHTLLTFNTLPHLDHPDDHRLITYA
jgi:broad specificity phosphatase PhoE